MPLAATSCYATHGRDLSTSSIHVSVAVMSGISKSLPICARVLTAASFSLLHTDIPCLMIRLHTSTPLQFPPGKCRAIKRDKLNLPSAASEPRLGRRCRRCNFFGAGGHLSSMSATLVHRGSVSGHIVRPHRRPARP